MIIGIILIVLFFPLLFVAFVAAPMGYGYTPHARVRVGISAFSVAAAVACCVTGAVLLDSDLAQRRDTAQVKADKICAPRIPTDIDRTQPTWRFQCANDGVLHTVKY